MEDAPEERACFLCAYRNDPPEKDRDNLVLWRTPRCTVLMNRFPYTGGHLLIAPHAHVPNQDGLDDATMLEMMQLSRDMQQVLSQTIYPHGFNVGINVNRCAGAGLPDHVHMHIVPRWDGDTNFMATVSDARVISQGLDDLYDELLAAGKKHNLPGVPTI